MVKVGREMYAVLSHESWLTFILLVVVTQVL
jgi:hypothetical protein